MTVRVRFRRLAAGAFASAAGVAAALALAGPAWAHGGDAPDGTNYRTEVTGLTRRAGRA